MVPRASISSTWPFSTVISVSCGVAARAWMASGYTWRRGCIEALTKAERFIGEQDLPIGDHQATRPDSEDQSQIVSTTPRSWIDESGQTRGTRSRRAAHAVGR